MLSQMKPWPHAPSHQVDHPGSYMVTAATLHKAKFYDTPEKLNMIERLILETFAEFEWQLQAWAVFPNHYHVIGFAPEDPKVARLTGKLHSCASRELNRMDNKPGRKVWYQYWDSNLTFEKSYLARLSYVHRNAVHHGLVGRPEDYLWCSANWFFLNSTNAFYDTVMTFPIDTVNVADDF